MTKNRFFVRYPIHLEVKIFGHESNIFASRACDLSTMGMSLIIPRSAVTELSYTGLNMEVGDRIMISVPNESTGKSCQINCSIAHARRLSQNQYFVGIYFIDPKPEARFCINSLLKTAQSQEEEEIL